MIDFGIQAYQEKTPARDIEVGSGVAGIVYLSVDPFPYFEQLAQLPDIRPLVYTWDIVDIRRIVGPSEEVESSAAGEPLRFEH